MKRDDYKKAVYLGMGMFAAQLMWMVYNTYMPIFLQAGGQGFASLRGFGLSASLTGFIMTLDNLAAFFIQPLMGPVSDRTRTRFGRRLPWILVFAPLSAVAFALIPVGPLLIPAELSGMASQLTVPLAITIGAAIVMVLCMALWRTPLFALMPDLFPSPLRSQANALVNIMSGIGGILAFAAGGLLFGLNAALPFAFGAVITLAAVAVLFLAVREPAAQAESSERAEGLRVLSRLRQVPKESKRSLALLILVVFFYMLGYMALETFFSSYAVARLGLKPSVAGLLLALSYVSFLATAMPSAALARRLGRKRAVGMGLVIFALALIAIRLSQTLPMTAAMLVLGGFGWALVNINCLPMILDSSEDEALMGTYSGLYFIATTLAGTIGPILNGWIIDLSGRDYGSIFLVCPVFFGLSLLVLSGVTTGEVKRVRSTSGEADR